LFEKKRFGKTITGANAFFFCVPAIPDDIEDSVFKLIFCFGLGKTQNPGTKQ
jgi:hypothetical protein